MCEPQCLSKNNCPSLAGFIFCGVSLRVWDIIWIVACEYSGSTLWICVSVTSGWAWRVMLCWASSLQTPSSEACGLSEKLWLGPSLSTRWLLATAGWATLPRWRSLFPSVDEPDWSGFLYSVLSQCRLWLSSDKPQSQTVRESPRQKERRRRGAVLLHNTSETASATHSASAPSSPQPSSLLPIHTPRLRPQPTSHELDSVMFTQPWSKSMWAHSLT